MPTAPLIEPPEISERHAEIHALSESFARELLERFTAPFPTLEPFEWCVQNLVFADSEVKGPFDPTGRYYLRDIINDNNNDDVRYQTMIAGAGVSKTNSTIGGLIWKIVHRPPRCLMIMPATKGEGGSETFATSRFIPALEATAATRDLIPDGQRRLFLNSKRVRLNGAHIGFVGGNSPTQVASNRCGDIRVDEADKTKGKLGDEAGLISLAQERFEGVTDYQFFLNTTPTVETRAGWKKLHQSDFRRRFLPCPHCNGEVIGKKTDHFKRETLTTLRGWMDLAWSEQYCVLPVKFLAGGAMEAGTPVPRAYVHWDKEAKRKDGEFDLNRVFRSARFECPHCGGHILDEHKIWQDKNGIWLPLQAGTPHHRGYHLPSLYSPPLPGNENSLLGGRCLKFLNAHEDGEGMKGFINSTLAEVDIAQEMGRIELSTEKNFSQNDWTALMTVDFQKLWPFLWFMVQKWSSFKLLPSLPITNGKPYFIDHFATAPELKALCETIVSGADLAWFPLAELMRFDTRTGSWPMLEWCIAQNLIGQNLVSLFREKCNSDTLTLGRYIFNAMGVRMPKGGDSEIIAAGHCEMSGDDAWAELKDIQAQFSVGTTISKLGISPNNCVLIDAGYAEEHNPEVLRKCFESGANGRFEYYDPLNKKFVRQRLHQFVQPVPIDAWVPFKGYPINKRWRSGGIEREWQYSPDDPFKGTSEAGRYTVAVLEAASDLYFHRWMDSRDRQPAIQKAIAENRTYRGNLWNVSNDLQLFPAKRFTREQFNAQMNARGRDADGEIWERGTGGGGKRRHPDHLNDCARNQYPLAESLGFFSYEQKEK